MRAAAKAGGPDISFGAARLRHGRGEKHTRYVGNAVLTVIYKGVSRHRGTNTVRPAYDVHILVGRFKHKLTVGGSASWHEDHGVPSSPEAIDAAAGAAVRFAATPDDDVPEHIADAVNAATEMALKENGDYDVRRSP